jgi:hypothetical protein
MAEAIAHLKAMSPPVGRSVRLLRPINGPAANHQIVVELGFEDIDAALSSYGRPGPAGEWERRWVEFSQSRGHWELYEVAYEVPSDGPAGNWLDRRTRWVRDRQREACVALWRRMPAVSWEGYSFRVLVPYTGERAPNVLVAEWTASSVPGMLEPYYAMRATPEGSEWAASIWALETQATTVDLYRVVE